MNVENALKETDAGHKLIGNCAVCGYRGPFEQGSQQSVREGFNCPDCNSSLRYRDQAQAILNEFANGHEISLNRLVANGRLDEVHIYEPAIHGPFVSRFRHLRNYTHSYYWEDAQNGDVINGVAFENLHELSFPDMTFDLVITSDVMEHVADPYIAFAEIHRVLKIGGVHIFSIPNRWPIDNNSLERAKIVDGTLEYILEPRYHRAGDGSPSLVITEFGSDIVEKLAVLNYSTQIVRESMAIYPAYQNATFVARRMK